jgi:ribosomal protein S18 acetylase RimI-like enzyme
MKVKYSTLLDLDQIAKCHVAAFPTSLSSMLGKKFRKKMFSWYINNERGVLFHVEENSKIIGYCGGIITKHIGLPGAASSITQYSFNTFLISFILRPWLILHPENISRFSFFIKNLKMKLGLAGFKREAISGPDNFQTFWGLVVIGVHPKFQGKGIGSIMLQEFERLARLDKVDKITLSVKSTNTNAINSYKANGWKVNNTNIDSLNLNKIL